MIKNILQIGERCNIIFILIFVGDCMEKNKLPTRKHNRYRGFDYTTHGCCFVTICLDRKSSVFLWNRAETRKWIKTTEKHYKSIVDDRPVKPMNYEALVKNLPLSAEGRIVENHIQNLHTFYPGVRVELYTIMHDHIHLLIVNQSENEPISLERIVKQFKRGVTVEIGKQIWQKSFYDTIITHQKQYDNIFEYIYNNPLKYIYRCPETKKILGNEYYM